MWKLESSLLYVNFVYVHLKNVFINKWEMSFVSSGINYSVQIIH